METLKFLVVEMRDTSEKASPVSRQSRRLEALMAAGDKQGKGVCGAEQSWMCFRNAKGQGLSPSPWQGRCCPSLIAQGSSRATGMWGCAMPRAAPWGGPCQAAGQGQGGNEAPAQQGSLALSCWPQAQGQQPWPKGCTSCLWQGLAAAQPRALSFCLLLM